MDFSTIHTWDFRMACHRWEIGNWICDRKNWIKVRMPEMKSNCALSTAAINMNGYVFRIILTFAFLQYL